MIIYLSPSKQPRNIYFDKKTTEEYGMNKITDYLVEYLKPYIVDVIRGGKSVEVSDRIVEANKLKPDYYLSLHSNAGGGSGCETFYQVGNNHSTDVRNKSKAYAGKLNFDFSDITTTNGKDGDRGIKYKQLSDGRDYNGELRNVSCPANLIEVEFHDTVAGGTWLLNNHKNIGYKIGAIMVDMFSLKLKPTTPIDFYYYVQTGAYPTLAEAEVEALKVTTAIQQVAGIKYGNKNNMDWIKSVPITDKPTPIVKEVIKYVDKVVEIPVEVIKYVDKIIEVEKPFKETFIKDGLTVVVEKIIKK